MIRRILYSVALLWMLPSCNAEETKTKERIYYEMIGCFCDMTPLNDSGHELRMATCVNSAQSKMKENCSNCKESDIDYLEENVIEEVYKFKYYYSADPLNVIFECRKKYPRS